MSVDSSGFVINEISALDNIMDTFSTIAMLKAPLVGIPIRQVKVRGLIRTHLKQLSEIDGEEMERFLGGIIDLFSSRMSADRIKEISKKIGRLDKFGSMLDTVQENYSRLSVSERFYYLSLVSKTLITNLDELRERLSIETINTDEEEKFRYLLVTLTIVHRILNLLRNEMRDLDHQTEGNWENRINDIMSLALFSMVRIEAFRRGKIDIEDLRDTLTLMISSTSVQDYSPEIMLPEDMLTTEV